ncbi:MAG TPA: alkyl sulfatase dimerization domain-containing protein [Polyangiaceae bacterium]|nr:alkyl sulfatase dimerization domain-containing protein [Polyangiaceae bacterium]
MRGKPPDEAKFFWSGGPITVAPRTWFASAFSGVTAFETDTGLVLVDSGLEQQGGLLASMIRQETSAPVHTAIFTQGHVDHAFGLKHFLSAGQPAPRVVAHRLMPARFARYELTAGHNAALNARQFGGTVRASEYQRKDYDTFRAPELPPTQLYDDQLDLDIGGVRFEVHYCRGETDDHSWIYCPERGVLCPGDLFIYAVPNAGNPQKVQRYPWDWANGLRQMAARKPRSLCPGHGGPVVNDPDKIQTMLLETASYLDVIVERTLAALNDGSPPHVDIVERVEIPSSASPWLDPVYDEAEFIVRNIIRYYGGWWTGRPSELKPAPRASVALEMAALAGGAERLAERARALADAGDLRLACHLADYALEAAPGDRAVQSAVSEIYERRAAGETSLMAINLFNSAAEYAREGRPFR